VICFSLPCFSKVKIAYVDVAPYAYQDVDNRAKGQLIEKFREIMYSLEMEIEFIHLPHRRQIEFIEQGKVDLWAGQKNSQVNNELSLVSKTPLFVMALQAYWRAGTKGVTKLEDLNGKNLIMISSYSYGGNYSMFAKESQSATYVINHEDGFKKLLSGSNEYFLGYKDISQEVIEKFHITDIRQTPLAEYTLHLKLAKTFPNAIEVMKKVDVFLSTQNATN
jgi:hypothetical protein